MYVELIIALGQHESSRSYAMQLQVWKTFLGIPEVESKSIHWKRNLCLHEEVCFYTALSWGSKETCEWKGCSADWKLARFCDWADRFENMSLSTYEQRVKLLRNKKISSTYSVIRTVLDQDELACYSTWLDLLLKALTFVHETLVAFAEMLNGHESKRKRWANIEDEAEPLGQQRGSMGLSI